MSMVRWSPLFGGSNHDLSTVQDEVNHLFEGFLHGAPLRTDVARAFAPAVDVEENPDEFVMRVDLPGLTQKDVKVNLVDDTLTIRGERKHEDVRKDNGYQRLERRFGAFERSFTFGTAVKNEGVKTLYRDGVLEIRVLKAEEAKLREIEIQVGS